MLRVSILTLGLLLAGCSSAPTPMSLTARPVDATWHSSKSPADLAACINEPHRADRYYKVNDLEGGGKEILALFGNYGNANAVLQIKPEGTGSVINLYQWGSVEKDTYKLVKPTEACI